MGSMKLPSLGASVIMALGAILPGTVALAAAVDSSAASTTPPATLEEVVVTAERREATTQRSALSISVVGADQLESKGISNVTTLLNSIPGLQVNNVNISTNISLRGLLSSGSTMFADPVIGFNLGGVALSRGFAESSAFYDLQRVEVLKGPQGTLYGRNATVGAINLIPARPGNEFGGNVVLDVGNYNSFNVNGALNLPFNDQWAARMAFSTHRHTGYLTNGYSDADNQGGRLSVQYKPSDDLTVLVWADFYRDNSKGWQGIYRYPNPNQEYQNDNPWFALQPAGCGTPILCPAWSNNGAGGPVFAAPFNALSVIPSDGYSHLRQVITAAQIDWNFGGATLTVIPAHVGEDMDTLVYGAGLSQNLRNKTNQNSIEARLASNGDGRLKWLVGGMYFKESADAGQWVLEPNGYQQIFTPNLIDESRAAFGQATYSITSRFRATLGLRYTSETKTMDGSTVLDGAFNTTTCPSPGTFVTGAVTAYGRFYPIGYCVVPNFGDLTNTDTSYKAGLEFDVASQSMLYGHVSTGFKTGGFAPGLPPNTFKPEKLTAYEIGSKNRFFDERLQANLEVFYWNYKDQQIGILQAIHPAGQSSVAVNVPGYVKGAELDLSARPLRNTLVALDTLYEKGQYDLYPTVVSSSGTIGGLSDYPRVALPEWSITARLEQTFPLAAGGSITAGADAHHESSENLRPLAAAALTAGDFRPAYTLWNARITYAMPGDKWSLSTFMDNIGNVAVFNPGVSGTTGPGTFYRPATNPANARVGNLNAPRTYGLRLSAKF